MFLTILIFFAGAVLLVLGVALMREGYRPRRVGDSPHCARCDYLAGGLQTARCPECGADLSTPRAIVKGDRTTRPPIGRAGIAVTFLGIAIGTGPMVAQIKYVNWYHHKPASWVIDDYNASDWERSAKAWRELQRRFGQSPSLPQDSQGDLDDAIIRKMEASPGAIQTPGSDAT